MKQGPNEVVDLRTDGKVSVHRRIWRNVNKEQQLLLSKNSDHYKYFQDDEDGATVGNTVWSHVLSNVGTCVCNPLPELCFDEKISGPEHMGTARSLV